MFGKRTADGDSKPPVAAPPAAAKADAPLATRPQRVEPETANDQSLEMPQQKIREVERPRFCVRERREHGRRGEELIAMSARNAFHALFAQHHVEQSTGAAIAVRDENRSIALA